MNYKHIPKGLISIVSIFFVVIIIVKLTDYYDVTTPLASLGTIMHHKASSTS